MTRQIRAVLCDVDGVIFSGETPIATAFAALIDWQARAIPFAFVTNNSSFTAADFAARLKAEGITVGADRIVTPIGAVETLIRSGFAPGPRVMVIGNAGLAGAALAAGAEIVADASADLVLLGTDYDLTYDKLRQATRALLAGARLVATNPDLLSPTPEGPEPCVGALVALFVAAVPGLVPTVLGKPAPDMLIEAARRLQVPAEGIAMVGDQIATDMRAALSAGMHPFLVTTGLPLSRQGVPPAQVTVIESLSEIPLRVPATAAR
ncbi:HAD-IIA family hydrolase [Frigidibacter sp. MR17.24]|uniref:HAD-IIA family hydrolase n=1 Tax=Frigidibacter sp. MR17.24 TaxID=3127345 RepID=UPI003012AE03